MTLPILSIPDEIAEWPAWLDRQLVGIELRQLVQELEVIVATSDRPPTPNTDLESICGTSMPAVLTRGCAALSHDQLRLLLSQPHCLFELQERVLEQGGPFWDHIPRSPEHERAAATVRQRVMEEVGRSAPKSAAIPSLSHDSRDHVPRGRWLWPLASAALAASILLVFALLRAGNEPRFFSRPGVLASRLPEADFYRQLGDSVHEDWSAAERRGEPLQTTLVAFLASCDDLLRADLAHYSRHETLKTKCRNWRNKIDEQLTALQRGEKTESDARVAATETVEKLVQTLRTNNL